MFTKISLDKKAMSKIGLKSIPALRWLVRMIKINQIKGLISIPKNADIKVATYSILKKHETTKTKNATYFWFQRLKKNFHSKREVNAVKKN